MTVVLRVTDIGRVAYSFLHSNSHQVKDELPDFSPRYICLSYCYHHDDGRISFPLMFIYYCPGGVKPDHNSKWRERHTTSFFAFKEGAGVAHDMYCEFLSSVWPCYCWNYSAFLQWCTPACNQILCRKPTWQRWVAISKHVETRFHLL